MLGTCAGAQIVSAAQAWADGAFPAARNPFPAGATFRWTGTARRLDGARAALLLEGAAGQAELRERAPRAVAKLTRGRGAPMVAAAAVHVDPADDPAALIVTDGARRWSARLIPVTGGDRLLVFEDGLPPVDALLRVVQSPADPAPPPARRVAGLLAGAVIDTPDGPRAAADLRAGDRVSTRDGVERLVWTARTDLAAPRLLAAPELRPVRIRAGALGQANGAAVAPGHLVLLTDPRAQALWGVPEVLVEARMLVDGVRVLAERGAADVAYVHLLTRHHAVLRADGLWVESFRPGAADLSHLAAADAEALSRHVPEMGRDGGACGPPARRVLSAAELAILRHEGAPRHLRAG